MTRLVLASASQARLNVLLAAGIRPEVIPSDIDETAIPARPPRDLALSLAEAKAAAVAERLASGLVIGCDSLLEVTSSSELAGTALGKPASPGEARSLWQRLRGQTATLFTGHCLIDVDTGTAVSEVAATEVIFASPTDREIDAYVATGEPLEAAGAFKLEGAGGWFIEGIRGDYTNVIGISLPLLRRLLKSTGVAVTDLWHW
jgi:nucleoside triphosphate pyrophosphatase